MATITNRLGLPEPLVEAIRNDSYERGDADYTVTQLLKPPRVVALERRHSEELTEDASDRIWSLFGSAVHAVLERAAGVNSLVEKRFAIAVPLAGQEFTVSGQFDHMALDGDGLLQDYKTMSVWEYVRGVRAEREQQLNLLALILGVNGVEIRGLEAVCIFRDWSPSERLRSGRDYPQQQVVRVPLKLWTQAEQRAFLDERILLHEAAQVELPECSTEERWARPDTYAIMKDGRKSAVRVLPSLEEAVSYAVSKGFALPAFSPDKGLENGLEWGKGHRIEFRPGDAPRCRFYCAVSEFCDQWKAERPEVEGGDDGSGE